MVYASRIFLMANDRARDQTSDPTQCLWMKAGGTTKAAERRCVCFQRDQPWGDCFGGGRGVCAGLRGPQSLAYVRNAAKVEAAPVCMLAPACPRVFPLHPSAVLSAGATGVNAGRISLCWKRPLNGCLPRTAKTLVKGEGGSEAAAETWTGAVIGSGVVLTVLECVNVVGPCNGSRQWSYVLLVKLVFDFYY